MVMAMDMAKGNQVASVTQVVLSQEDLAETVEPSTHQSSALLSENPAITAREKVTSPNFVTPGHAPNLSSVGRKMCMTLMTTKIQNSSSHLNLSKTPDTLEGMSKGQVITTFCSMK